MVLPSERGALGALNAREVDGLRAELRALQQRRKASDDGAVWPKAEHERYRKLKAVLRGLQQLQDAQKKADGKGAKAPAEKVAGGAAGGGAQPAGGKLKVGTAPGRPPPPLAPPRKASKGKVTPPKKPK